MTGLQWRPIRPPLLVVGEVEEAHLEECQELGVSVAAGLEVGII